MTDPLQTAAQTASTVRTEANTFVNRNWWWLAIAVFAVGDLIGHTRWPF